MNLKLWVVVCVVVACNRTASSAPPISTVDLIGTYRVRGTTEVMMLLSNGTYVRKNRADPPSSWTLTRQGAQTWITFSDFYMPAAGGKTRWSTIVERVDGHIMIWFDADNGVGYEQVTRGGPG